MIGSGLFRKHFAIATISLFGFILLGSVFSRIIIGALISRHEAAQRIQFEKNEIGGPIDFMARLIDSFAPNDAVAGLKQLEKLTHSTPQPFQLEILDEKGNLLYGKEKSKFEKIAITKFPQNPYEVALLNDNTKNTKLSLAPPDFRPFPKNAIIRLKQNPARYLHFYDDSLDKGLFSPPAGMMPPGGPPGPILFFLTFGISILMVVFGIIFSLFVIFKSLQEHVKMADWVLSELKNGNLKARFPIQKNDEIGRGMQRFNSMADEIELLVEKLRRTEQSRKQLVQELAHDIRTPVAALKGTLEIIFENKVLEKGKFEELSSLAMKETEYIERLVQNLLLLAQVSEPNYRTIQRSVDIVSLIEEEAGALSTRFPETKLIRQFNEQAEIFVAGDIHLLRRLMRNALENAFSFAATEVTIKISTEAGTVKVFVSDNGPGFSQEALENFGERRSQRRFEGGKDGRLSMGLGSVIMKTVTIEHRGKIVANNKMGESGAILMIELPTVK